MNVDTINTELDFNVNDSLTLLENTDNLQKEFEKLELEKLLVDNDIEIKDQTINLQPNQVIVTKDEISNYKKTIASLKQSQITLEKQKQLEIKKLNEIIIQNNNKQIESTNNKELEDENEQIKSEIEDLKSKLIRIVADQANAAKQSELDIANTKKIAKKGLVKDLLPFLTSCVLSFDFVPEHEESQKFVNTLKKSLDKLVTDLDSHGVEVIIPQKGHNFDSVTMQALNTPNNDDPKILGVASVGVKIDKQVVVPASVLI
jgi:molecular chaperone GrpE